MSDSIPRFYMMLPLHGIIGVKIYRRFYTEEKEQTNGVLAITVSKLPVQPYTSLASLLSVGSLFSETIITNYLFNFRNFYRSKWLVIGAFDLLIFVSSLLLISRAEKTMVSLLMLIYLHVLFHLTLCGLMSIFISNLAEELR